METKVCFKCGRELPLSQFYHHPAMADGHLNKCKDCTKRDVHENYQKNIQREDFVEKERARGREKYHRLGYVSRKTAHKENKATRAFIKRKGIATEGLEIHHWNYNRAKDIFLLGRREHKFIHRFLSFDEKTKLFIYNGALLETKEQHRQILVELLKKGAEEIPEYNFDE